MKIMVSYNLPNRLLFVKCVNPPDCLGLTQAFSQTVLLATFEFWEICVALFSAPLQPLSPQSLMFLRPRYCYRLGFRIYGTVNYQQLTLGADDKHNDTGRKGKLQTKPPWWYLDLQLQWQPLRYIVSLKKDTGPLSSTKRKRNT